MAIKLMPCFTRDSHTHPLPARQATRREHSNPFRQVATSVPLEHGQLAPSTTVPFAVIGTTEAAATIIARRWRHSCGLGVHGPESILAQTLTVLICTREMTASNLGREPAILTFPAFL